MPWWAWLIVGFAMLAGELLAPGGFYLLFVGLGAIAVGLLTFLGLSGPEWTQWVLFTAISVLSVTTLRRRLAGSAPGSSRLEPSVVGETVVLKSAIEAGGVGQAEYRGSVWQVKNAGSSALESGARCRVDEVNGITLLVGRTAAELEEIDRWK